MSKSKRIKDAAKELDSALKKHLDVVTDSAVSMKKAQRAAARLASAAQVYAEAVSAKTGLDNPFVTGGGKLDDEATRSLLAERDGIAKSLTGQIPVLPDLPTEVDLSPAEFHALGSDAEGAPAAALSLDDAVEDWEDDSIEIDDDEPADADADDESSIDDTSVDAPAQDDRDGADVFASIVAMATASETPADEGASDAEPPAHEPGTVPWTTETVPDERSSSPRHAQPESEDAAPEGYEHIESVWSATPSDEPAESETPVDEPPALPDHEPSSEEEKPYSEDI